MGRGVTFKNRNNSRITFTFEEGKLVVMLWTEEGYVKITLGPEELQEVKDLLNGEKS